MRFINRILSRLTQPAENFSALEASDENKRLVVEPWYVDSVVPLSSGRVQINGWSLQDPNVEPTRQASRFSVNGRPPLEIEYPYPRPGMQEIFWQRPGAEMSGFRIVADAQHPNGLMEVRCRDSATVSAAVGRESWFLPDSTLHRNVPDEDRRFRVIGNRDLDGFLRLGATDAHRVRAAYENVTGKQWADLTALLDWGVGCGRVARHLAPELGDRFFGCDIDADNVSWCRANLPGSYYASQLEPPLPFPENSFDAIYGISVFTHLRAPWERKWLEELWRVLQPGGTILVTVHGQTAIDFAQLDPISYRALMDRVEKEGLAVTSSNNQLDGFVEHPEEYVNVFHSRKHIREVWGEFFTRIEHLPGYIFTHDLIVATK